MRVCSKEACVVVLTEKDVWLRINGKEAISLKANHMALVACDNNIIDFSSLNNATVVHISRDIIKDYLRFLNKISHKSPLATQCQPGNDRCLPDAGCVSGRRPAQRDGNAERRGGRTDACTTVHRAITLSRQQKFLSLLMHMLRSRISDSVYHIIESDIHKDWNLSLVASCLCLSPSLLKKSSKMKIQVTAK